MSLEKIKKKIFHTFYLTRILRNLLGKLFLFENLMACSPRYYLKKRAPFEARKALLDWVTNF